MFRVVGYLASIEIILYMYSCAMTSVHLFTNLIYTENPQFLSKLTRAMLACTVTFGSYFGIYIYIYVCVCVVDLVTGICIHWQISHMPLLISLGMASFFFQSPFW